MENIFGGLIEFENEEQFDNFMLSIDKESAIKVIETAIEFAYRNNMFSVQETYCIYKSLKKLKENVE
jgi:hypothetical protein